ncbi:MAG: CRISPR-associated helicase Cas3' [Thermodesulfobacteriota bacterium]
MIDMITPPSLSTADYKRLWAKSKPRHPLWKHLLDASAVSLALSPPVISFGWNPEVSALLVGLHDIGKADSCFQHQVPDFSDELVKAGYPVTGDARCRHERISSRFMKNMLVTEGLDSFVADAISRSVLVHHGYWNETARDVGQEYGDAQNQLCLMLRQVLDIKAIPSESPSDLSAFGMLLAGHVVLCDWIASNEKFFGNDRLKNEDDPKRYFAAARAVASEWVDRLGLKRDRQAGTAACIVETARPIQRKLLDTDIPPGLVIIEAPMGEGKTEAAWILAEKWRSNGYHGMYMALPTMATSDSLHGRYRDDYLNKLGRGEDAKLVHGMAWLRDDKEPQIPSEVGEPGDDRSLAAAWFRPTRRAMLVAHGVGTVDQAMLAGMHVKFGFLRLYGLADRVLVIDEVHAYDAYMSAIIARLLQWCACLKIPVILLSATLSSGQRAAMLDAYGATGGDLGPEAPYPLITVAEPGKEACTIKANASSSRTLKIEPHTGLLGDAKKTAAKAAELVKNGGCCCVILNTVKQAQAVYQAPALKTVPKLLFHARFTAADRERIANEVLDMFGRGRWEGEGENRKFKPAERPDKFILVATQVVEQSLDVDFDHMISEIAPIDLLLQRSGRIKRHTRDRNGNLFDGPDERGEPALHVLVPTRDGNKPPRFGPSEIIYRRYPLLRTLEALKDSGEIKLPEKFRPLIEAVYGGDLLAGASDDLKKAKMEWDDLQEDLAAQAGEFLLCEPMADEFDPVGADEVGDDSDDGNGWRARTRLGLEDVLVIPLSAKQVEKYKAGDLHPRLVKCLYKRSVKIPPYYWPPRPAKGYDKPELGSQRLRGVWLLPVKKEGEGWKWEGIKDDKKAYEIKYDPTIGLAHGGDK